MPTVELGYVRLVWAAVCSALVILAGCGRAAEPRVTNADVRSCAQSSGHPLLSDAGTAGSIELLNLGPRDAVLSPTIVALYADPAAAARGAVRSERYAAPIPADLIRVGNAVVEWTPSADARAGRLLGCLERGSAPGTRTVALAAPFASMRAPADLSASQAEEFRQGRAVVAGAGCLACHSLDGSGDNGPGPALDGVGSRLPAWAIAHALAHPTAPMPSFIGLPAPKFDALVLFLSSLR
jgi:mono/diheme cytochrome c family protein